MNSFDRIIEKFINNMHYREDSNVIGIVFYGSALSGYYNSDSDIDLHIITKSGDLYRGAYTFKDEDEEYKVEFFIKTITELYRELEIDFENGSNSLLAIIGYGKIIYDTNEVLSTLQKDIKSVYQTPLPPLGDEEAKATLCTIDNRMNQLNRKCKRNEPDFDYLYYTTVDKLRKFYSALCGCPDIPTAKVARIYTDEKYREAFCKSIIPEEEFIKLFLKTIYCKGSIQEKLIAITNLFDYSKKNIDIDLKNHKTRIRSIHNTQKPNNN